MMGFNDRFRNRPFPELLAAYADGELDAAGRAHVEAWLAEHPEAHAELETQRNLSRKHGRLWQTSASASPGEKSWSRLLVRRSSLTIIIVAIVAAGAGLFGGALRAGFVPDEDQGIFGIAVQLPPGASLERTSSALGPVENILGHTEGVESYQTIGGYGAVTSTYQPNFGTIFIRLKPWEERHGEALHVFGIMRTVQRELAGIPEALAFPFNIPTISGFHCA